MATILFGFDSQLRPPGRQARVGRASGRGGEAGVPDRQLPRKLRPSLREGEERITAEFRESQEYFPVTPPIAKSAGLLRRDWRRKGLTLSYSDVTIAAVALAHGLTLFTDNRKHFPMAELELLPLPGE